MGFLDRLLGRGKKVGADAMREADRLADRGKEMMGGDGHEHEHEHGTAAPEAAVSTPGATGVPATGEAAPAPAPGGMPEAGAAGGDTGGATESGSGETREA